MKEEQDTATTSCIPWANRVSAVHPKRFERRYPRPCECGQWIDIQYVIRMKCLVRGILRALAFAVLMCRPAIGQLVPFDELVSMSLEELMEVKIALTSRAEVALFETAAAAFVLTSDDIRRAGLSAGRSEVALRLLPAGSLEYPPIQDRQNSTRHPLAQLTAPAHLRRVPTDIGLMFGCSDVRRIHLWNRSETGGYRYLKWYDLEGIPVEIRPVSASDRRARRGARPANQPHRSGGYDYTAIIGIH